MSDVLIIHCSKENQNCLFFFSLLVGTKKKTFDRRMKLKFKKKKPEKLIDFWTEKFSTIGNLVPFSAWVV